MTAWTTQSTAQSSRWISREFSSLLARVRRPTDAPPADKADFDVLIIGSGYGGAMAAATFAGCQDKQGKEISVALIERGVEYLPGAFPSRAVDLPRRLRAGVAGKTIAGEGLFDLRMGKDMNVVTANGLGGGSLINAGVMETPAPGVFDGRWPAVFNEGSALERYYERARELLGAAVVPAGRNAGADKAQGEPPKPQDNNVTLHAAVTAAPGLIAKREVLRKLANGKGYRDAAITVAMSDERVTSGGVNLHACKLCGDCATGCNYAAKESLDTNLLVQAHRRGALIYCGGTALLIRQGFLKDQEREDDKRKPIWEVQLVHTDPKLRLREGPPVWVSARKLVLAAGALGSSELLMRSQRASASLRFSPALGQRFSGNGDMLSFGFAYGEKVNVNAFADEDQSPDDRQKIGPTITGIVDVTLGGKPAVIEDLAVPGALRRLAEELVTTSNCLRELASVDRSTHKHEHPAKDPFAINPTHIQRTAIFAVIADDGAQGALRLDVSAASDLGDGHVSVVWPAAKDQALCNQQNKELERRALQAGLGGHVIPNPLWRPLPEGKELFVRNQLGPLTTVHPLGGCAMADTPDRGVVTAEGAVFDGAGAGQASKLHEGLYVLDGAIIPSALGTNPALTIAAVALRAAEQLRNDWNWTQVVPGWTFHDKAQRRPVLANRPDTRKFPPDWAEPLPVAADVSDVLREVVARQTKIEKHAVAEFTERMSGPVCLMDDRDEEHACRVELTLTFDPVVLRDLFMADDDGALSKAQLRLGQRNELPMLNPRDPDANRMLRIFLEKDWQALQLASLTPKGREDRLMDAALCVFGLKAGGTLTLLRREPSTSRQRFGRTFGPWLLNRGVRDIVGTGLAPRHFPAWVGQVIKRRQQRKAAAKAGLPMDSQWERWRKRGESGADLLRSMRELLSHAGEVRLFEYELHVGERVHIRVAKKSEKLPVIDYVAACKRNGGAISGRKRITYARPSNPWRQLMELDLESFPLKMRGADAPVLCLDARYLIQRNTALLRFFTQPDGMSGLADALSLAACFLRMLLVIHDFNLRKPELPRARRVQRLPGTLVGLPEPQIHTIEVDRLNDQPVLVRLTRYRLKHDDATRIPVLLIHGYSASGTTYAHPSLEPSLAQVLAAAGRDVWVADLRTSAGLPTATHPWTFERVALADIPAAVDFVYRQCGAQKVEVVAHCMGAAMFSMSVLSASTPLELIISPRDHGLTDRFGAERRALPQRIRSAVLSQIGPVLVMSAQNSFRSYVYSFVTELFGAMPFNFRPEANDGLGTELLDRLFSSLPYPDEELLMENHGMPWRSDDHIGSRHRMDALYGRTFTLKNFNRDVLDHIDDFFGPLNLETVAQVAHFTRQLTVTNRGGRNRFISTQTLREHWNFPSMSLHGEHNGLADLATLNRMDKVMDHAKRTFEPKTLKNVGHQDSLIGNLAARTCEDIVGFLRKNQG